MYIGFHQEKITRDIGSKQACSAPLITLLKRDNAHTITEGLELVETYIASLKEPPKAKMFGKEISRIFNARGGSFHYSVAGAAKFFKADELRVDHVFMCCRHDDTNKHWSYLIIRCNFRCSDVCI